MAHMILLLVDDPATHLGAKVRNWKYPASEVQLLTLMALSSDEKAMPWHGQTREEPIDEEERAELEAWWAEKSAIK